MKSVTIYHKTVPNSKNQEKIDLLKFYSQGVRAVGDIVIDCNDYNYQLSDVGVIQGWLGQGTPTASHLKLRHTVIEQQFENKKFVLAADSNLFLYADIKNSLHYLRYSFNGVFPNTGIYCDNVVDSSRWKKISKDLNISLKDYRTSGEHILVCLQRNGGWSMGSVDVQNWTNQLIVNLRQYTDRPIILRLHPGDKSTKSMIGLKNKECTIDFSKNVRLSINESLLDDLKNCWAVINHNSSPVVGAAIEGYPIFVLDPERSQSKDVANIDISKIENPDLLDRQRWVERLSMLHWNFRELQSGECWFHMRKFI